MGCGLTSLAVPLCEGSLRWDFSPSFLGWSWASHSHRAVGVWRPAWALQGTCLLSVPDGILAAGKGISFTGAWKPPEEAACWSVCSHLGEDQHRKGPDWLALTEADSQPGAGRLAEGAGVPLWPLPRPTAEAWTGELSLLIETWVGTWPLHSSVLMAGQWRGEACAPMRAPGRTAQLLICTGEGPGWELVTRSAVWVRS